MDWFFLSWNSGCQWNYKGQKPQSDQENIPQVCCVTINKEDTISPLDKCISD